jgi:hypothetical protein
MEENASTTCIITTTTMATAAICRPEVDVTIGTQATTVVTIWRAPLPRIPRIFTQLALTSLLNKKNLMLTFVVSILVSNQNHDAAILVQHAILCL